MNTKKQRRIGFMIGALVLALLGPISLGVHRMKDRKQWARMPQPRPSRSPLKE